MPWGIAAAAGISALGSAFGKKKSKTPKYIQNASKDLIGRATTIADKDYTGYDGGSGVADLSSNERSAIGLARSGNADATRALAGSEKAVNDSMSEFNSDAIKSYMNPYTDAVLQPRIREQNRQYDRNKQALANSKGGAWGGDRSAFAASELERNQMEQVDDITADTYSKAFESARATFFADKDRQARGAQALRSLADGYQNMNRQQIQDLMATGGMERLIDQAKIDFDYNQFKEARDWDVTNLEPLLRAVTTSAGADQTTSGGSSAASAALGAGATLAGLYFGAGKKGPDEESIGAGTAYSDIARSGTPSQRNA